MATDPPGPCLLSCINRRDKIWKRNCSGCDSDRADTKKQGPTKAGHGWTRGLGNQAARPFHCGKLLTFSAYVAAGHASPVPPSPPAEKATARQDQNLAACLCGLR